MDTIQLVRTLRAHTKITANNLSGRELAELFENITAREVAEGGPYAFLTTENPESISVEELNFAIAEFLLHYGIELPNMAEYTAHAKQVELERPTNTFKLREWEEKRVLDGIRRAAHERLQGFPEEFQERALRALEKTTERNLDKQMSLMPLFMLRALGRKGVHFKSSDLHALGLANVFFWTAFIIYDDFWDEDESADPQLLPVANMFARHYIDYFSTLFHDADDEKATEKITFRSFFHQLMDKLDAANAWETQHCRMYVEGSMVIIPEKLPDYGLYENKFYPASGHIAGPVAMLVQLGYAVDSAEVSSLIHYFQNYLIAMQLHDDAHDWKEDLQRGHISTVVVKLLEQWRAHNLSRTCIDLAADMPELEQLFWTEVIVPICNEIVEFCAKSREALLKLTCIGNVSSLEQCILRNERAATAVLREHAQSSEFIAAVQKSKI